MNPAKESTYSDTIIRDLTCTILASIVFFVLIFLAEQHLGTYSIQILNLIAINAILAISLNLIYGFTGMFSLGHAGFMAIGAYVCTLLILTPAQKQSMWYKPMPEWLLNLSAPFFMAILIAGVIAMLLGLLIAIPTLRLGGDYFGIATLGFAEIIRITIVNIPSITNGALGIKGIPQPDHFLWWNFGWLAITVYVVMTLLKSNVGNIFKAIRDDEIAARTMGVNTFFYKVISFSIGAFFAGIGGALSAVMISTIDPKMFLFTTTFNILMIVVAGGLGSITGSIIGSVVITFMLEWLRIVEESFSIGSFEFVGIPGMRMVIFSMLLMAIILFWRRGILGMREFSWKRILGKGKKS